ncbi:hypothetical protein ACQPWY_23920 [Pseudonocardia xinjiangensis]|uniref:hypothetical protein n=1 Tax=Pseudonocardia xinjiangensis TaxID=75289 RepID=UPI003D8C2843
MVGGEAEVVDGGCGDHTAVAAVRVVHRQGAVAGTPEPGDDLARARACIERLRQWPHRIGDGEALQRVAGRRGTGVGVGVDVHAAAQQRECVDRATGDEVTHSGGKGDGHHAVGLGWN